MKHIYTAVVATIGLAIAAPAQAQPEYNETGWRAATGDEKKLREIFDGGKDDWSKSDGVPEMFDCMIAWAIWADTARRSGDTIPTISGHLTHAYAEGQLSHYLNALYGEVGGDVDRFTQMMIESASKIDTTVPQEDGPMMRYMGKCFVHPTSWNTSQGVTMTGPQFLREFLGQTNANDVYPVYVKNAEYRAEFDRLIAAKEFAAAANFAAKLHADPGLKSTVYWHEVLASSEIAAASGRGTELSAPLLQTLSKVWWPKWKRGWAKNLLRAKRGLPSEQASNRPPLHDPGKEPAWVKQEYDRYMRGETNYTPCNVWRKTFC